LNVFQIDPIQDPRWARFVAEHPRASIFHTPEWLETLRRTYRYSAVALTTSGPGEPLSNGVVFCRVNSWVTGSRSVSLPFSDHCDPLVNTAEEFSILLAALKRDLEAAGASFLELRPVSLPGALLELGKVSDFFFHQLDLRPGLEELYGRFHNNCIRRKIARAKKEELLYDEGNSESLLKGFYRLFVQTRRRHALPPQPISWFRNLIACMGPKLKLRVVSKGRQTVAAMLTLHHKDTIVYKYGCSDASFHQCGGMQSLFWRLIQEGKRNGARVLDLGRSDLSNAGLIAFKDRWGARGDLITYFRLYAIGLPPKVHSPTRASMKNRLAKTLVACLPDRLLSTMGGLIYPHIG